MALPNRRPTVHPGEVLRRDVLDPMEMTATMFASHCGLNGRYVRELVRGRRAMTAKAAWRIAQALGSTPEFWMNLQTAHDLGRTRPRRRVPRLAR